jgi:hypothetical protein
MTESLSQGYGGVFRPPSILEFSESLTAIAKALPRAQAALDAVVKKNTNPAFRSRYADLATVLDAVLPALNGNGITVLQPASFRDGQVAVVTMLLHESGEWMRSTLYLNPTKPDAQGVGSAITYGRRYGIMSMIGVAPEDDDANAAVGRPAPPQPAQPPQQKPKPPELTPIEQALIHLDAVTSAQVTSLAKSKQMSGRKLLMCIGAVAGAGNPVNPNQVGELLAFIAKEAQ